MLTYTKYPEFDFTLFVSKGATTIEDWLQTVNDYGIEGMTTRELYDLRRHKNLFSREEIGRILSLSAANQDLRSRGVMTAILVDAAVKYGLSRMYEILAESIGIRIDIQVFYQMGEAITWIGDDVAPCISK